VVAALVLGSAAVGLAAEQPGVAAAAKTSPASAGKQSPAETTAEALVRQLGDESYEKRRDAAARLAKSGLNAREALLAGLQDPDLEVRRGCRRLLAEVLEADFRRRLAALVADTEGRQPHDLPCWSRFCEVYGKDPTARKLFVEMLRSEPVLLESAEIGDELAVKAFQLRFQQVMQRFFGGVPAGQREPQMGTIAALLFVAVDSKLRLPPDLLGNPMWPNLFYRQAFQKALSDGEFRDISRKLLGRWIQQPTGLATAMQKLQFAVQFQIKEALDPALELLKDPKNPNANLLACGIEGTARLGGKPYAALLLPMLGENREVMRHQMMINNKLEVRIVEVRDVALAWLLELTGQDQAQYDMPEAKQWFDQLHRFPQQSFNFFNMGFKDPKQRDAALKKWEAWVKTNPLPAPPQKPPAKPAPPISNPAPPVGGGAAPVGLAPAKLAVGAVKDKDRSDPVVLCGLPLAERFQVQQLARARKLISQKGYAEAVGLLGDILAAPSDYSYRPDPDAPVWRRLKIDAEHLLSQLPPEGLAEYRSLFDAQARRRLSEALSSGGLAPVADVAQGYFFTEAGGEATYLLGTYYRTKGEFSRAASYFRRLIRDPERAARFDPALSVELAACCLKARMPQAAKEVLVQWKSRQPAQTVVLGGKSREVFASDEQALPWLEAIVGPSTSEADGSQMYAGSPTRNALAVDGNPWLKAKYQALASPDATLREAIEKVQKRQRENRVAALPSLHPLVVGQTVVTRTAIDIRAIDLASGAVRWEAPMEDPLEYFLRFADAEKKANAAEQVARGLTRRLWEDLSFGTMSSDGRLVFGLECTPFDLGSDTQSMVVLPNGRRQLDPGMLKTYNRLTAYDVKTGKVKWEAGGPPAEGGGPLAGAFFLGPPLPLEDQLYVVAEVGDQTRLLVLQPSDGTVLNQWTLAIKEQESATPVFFPFGPLGADPRRWGSSPSAADSVLLAYCVSGNRYVAVDLTTGSVVWAFEVPSNGVNRRNFFIMQAQANQADKTDRWYDPGVTIAAGRVLLCAPNSEDLVCLRLADGNQEWAVPRHDGLYVGGVCDGKVIVVGRKRVWALKLSDGTRAWDPGDTWLPPSAFPSGRGYLSPSCYYLPLSTAEVAAIDLGTGKILSRSRTVDGQAPGNLVNHQGAVLSQTIDAISRFDLLPARDAELVAQLHARPDDASLLAERGEVHFYQGRYVDAIDQFRRALKTAPSDHTRQLLRDTLCEGLQSDFDKCRPLATELESIFDTPELRGRFLQSLATGLRRGGRIAEAFDVYMKWIDQAPDVSKIQAADVTRTVRCDRWIGGSLADLYAAASPDQRAVMDRQIEARLRDDRLSPFIGCFAFHAAANDARLRLAQKAQSAAGGLLASELMLDCVLRHGTPQQQREAAAGLAVLYRSANRPEDAARCYRELSGPLADIVGRDGKRGHELTAALAKGDSVRHALDRTDPWPLGEPKKETKNGTANRPAGVNMFMPVLAPEANLSIRIAFATGVPSLMETDPDGRVRWKLPLDEVKIHPNFMGYVNQFSEGRLAGHLLVTMLGNRVCAVDALAEKGKMLWSQDSFTVATPQAGFPQMLLRRRFLMQRQAKPLATPTASPLAVTADYVCFEQDRKLVAVDPLSGGLLWTRDDLVGDSDLTGDEEIVLATPPDATEAIVLCGFDGRELGRRAVPPLSKRIAAFGRQWLIWDSNLKQTQLRLFDPWTQQVLWQHAFTDQAQFWLLDGDEIAVLEPAGAFVVLGVRDGKEVFKSQADRIDSLEGIVARHSPGGYVLIAISPAVEQNPFGGNNLTAGNINVGGWVYGFDATSGKRLWATQIPNQMFNVHQARDLPILTFYRQYMQVTVQPNGGFSHQGTFSQILCLDVRTGRILHQNQATAFDNQYEIDADPPGRRLEIHSNTHWVKFTYEERKP
jgi:outer membrane protein assembly factor BamB/tetratricopeptide (TPR) repeat protein